MTLKQASIHSGIALVTLKRYANTLGFAKVGYVDSTPKPSKSCYQNPFGRWE